MELVIIKAKVLKNKAIDKNKRFYQNIMGVICVQEVNNVKKNQKITTRTNFSIYRNQR